MCDKISQETLVAFADGQLSPGEATKVSEHIAQCDSCRQMVEALQRSIELVKVSWAAEQSKWPKWRLPYRPRLNRWPVTRVLAVAASILLLIGLGLIWRMVSEPGKAALNGKTIARLEQAVIRAGIAAQMLAVADLLSKQTGGQDYARERYNEIISDYSDTEHAVQAKLRLKTL